MQYNSKEIYKEVSEENNISLASVKVVGDTVFLNINKRMKSPSSIILRIKGLGFFFLRNLKMQKFLEYEKNKGESGDKELINILEARVEDYKRYLEKKKQIKQYRIEHGEIVKPIIQEEE